MMQHTSSFREWWKEHGKAHNNKDLQERQELTAYTLWHIWKARNAWNFNDEKRTEREIVQ